MSSCAPERTSGIRYYDTSAVLPLYLSEPASEAAHDALAQDHGQLVTSVLTVVEVRSGLARLERLIACWLEERRKRTVKINWQFTTTDARIKLKRLYPQMIG